MSFTGFFDAINTSTRRKIVPGVVDNVFKNDPTLAYLKKNNLEKFTGGTNIQENLLYGRLPGAGSYAVGASFQIQIAQVETGASFLPKNYVVPVAIAKEQIQIFNKGPEAVFRLIDSRLQTAALQMSEILAIDLYKEGQSAANTLNLNGLDEALNDGTTHGWEGSAFSLYGTLSRNGTIGAALNSPMTTPAANVNGPITYKTLEEAYNTVVIGDEFPNLMVTTNLGLSYIKEKFQPQWRTETTDPNIGFTGLKFNSSMVMQSQYAPGTLGVTLPSGDTNITAAGETLWYLNTKYIRLWVSDDPEFGFGFTGFKPAQDTTTVAGQYLFAGNLTVQAPRLMRQLYGISG